MTKQELLEQYDMYDVPEAEQDKYLHHVNEVVGDTTILSSKTRDEQTDKMVKLSMILRSLRGIEASIMDMAGGLDD